ncbi:hypothetical protein BpHYR1_013833 [Brachionus plicatilis]|uniref:Uncharacterized protein n=1 Tax=Brachionus plicatilis TaxID=10195 RepID=A0A3M7PRL2_BRAPC|nr:hypothetical protein BpHYR1_013833 [Brachionus plicatilis]
MVLFLILRKCTFKILNLFIKPNLIGEINLDKIKGLLCLKIFNSVVFLDYDKNTVKKRKLKKLFSEPCCPIVKISPKTPPTYFSVSLASEILLPSYSLEKV